MNYFNTTNLNFESTASMEYICAVTVLTPKMQELFHIANEQSCGKTEHPNLRHLLRLISETEADCKTLIEKCRKNLSETEGFSEELLKNTETIYWYHDYVILAGSIQEKIKQWIFAFALAASERDLTGGNEILKAYKEADKKLIARSELSSSDLADELTSYADEMEAWLDIELVDEMEAWENECGNPEMEDFWGIVTRIRLLAENL